jgi:hypothetical protein
MRLFFCRFYLNNGIPSKKQTKTAHKFSAWHELDRDGGRRRGSPVHSLNDRSKRSSSQGRALQCYQYSVLSYLPTATKRRNYLFIFGLVRRASAYRVKVRETFDELSENVILLVLPDLVFVH